MIAVGLVLVSAAVLLLLLLKDPLREVFQAGFRTMNPNAISSGKILVQDKANGTEIAIDISQYDHRKHVFISNPKEFDDKEKQMICTNSVNNAIADVDVAQFTADQVVESRALLLMNCLELFELKSE